MPEVKLIHNRGMVLHFTDSNGTNRMRFIVTACAPDDVVDQIKAYHRSSHKIGVKEALLWAQGKNWGVLADGVTTTLTHDLHPL
jgi:hypothetical protein